jgi:class 3 adenylate cyclase/tetratricopeptide (TPR) repeat protein
VICARCSRSNSDTAKFCSECGSALEAAAPEQRKVVTVLFCDVSGSTGLGESLDPETLRVVMSRYFDTARTAIERHGGTVEKFIGDAVMAVFGIPVAHEDDALRAVRAALELRDAVEIDVRIGVNTGPVVTGGPETLATGDAVNVAARLEQAAGIGEVLIGAETHALVRDVVDAEVLQPLAVKGKAQPLTVFRLRAVTSEPARRDAAPMVGRSGELELLARAYERAVHDRACHLFTVLGTAGIGKSRLVAEFLEKLSGARVVHGRCLSYGEGITYWPVVGVVKQLGDLPDDSMRTPLATLLGEGQAGTTPPEIAWAVRKTFEHVAADQPLVVVFDDIQWGEPTFLDLIEHVADLSRGAAILLLCMARPELLDVRPGWGGGKLNATSVLLEPLHRDDTDALVQALFFDADPGLVARIRDAADGNPLFVEEMVELARTTGGDVAVPPSIHALLAARLDSLPAGERAVLARGAVEGQVFHRNAVAALAPDEEHVDSRLVSLVRKELVRPDQPALLRDDAYRFRHLLIRDAAYEALPKSTRIDLHERFAAWLDEHGAALVELDEIVGYHLEQAVQYAAELGHPVPRYAGLAGTRLAAAAERAYARGDAAATLSLAQRAEALFAPDDPRRLAQLPLLAAGLYETGRFEESVHILDEAVERGDALTSAKARVFRAWTRSHTVSSARLFDDFAEIERAIAELERLGDMGALVDAYVARGRMLFWSGSIEAARESVLRARDDARAAGDRRHEAVAVEELLVALDWLGTPRSEVQGLASDVIADESFGPRLHARARISLARCAISEGRLDDAAAFFADAVHRYEELGLEVQASAYQLCRFDIGWVSRDWELAEAGARASWDRLGALGEVGYRSTAGAVLAAVVARRDPDEAAAILDEAARISPPDDVATEFWIVLARSLLAAAVGEEQQAIELGREALALASVGDDAANKLYVLTELAEVLMAAGRTAEAGERVAEAVRIAEERGSPAYAERARAVLA